MSHENMKVYDLPYGARRDICRILDVGNDWKDLAGLHMGYSPFEVQEIENEARQNRMSPAEHLLIKWGQLNHGVLELFMLLARMKYLTAMECLRDLINPRFHILLNEEVLDRYIERERLKGSIGPSRDRAQAVSTSDSNIPIPNGCIEKGVKEKGSNIMNGTDNTTDNNISRPTGSDASLDLRDSASAIPNVEYVELVEATKNWDSSMILGQGGFGIVFKGSWRHTSVAIKRLNVDAGLIGESLRELHHLNSCRHDNVLALYGYSVGGDYPCLVYQLMAGGSLDQRLKCVNGRLPLKWMERMRIARGVACGLQFMHKTQPTPLIHGDIKSPNILLDAYGEAKIGDFGLARQGPGQDRTHIMVTKVHGTRPYLPDELLRSHCLSPAVDTYSFGVVLFELATALRPYDKLRHRELKFLKDFVTLYSQQGQDIGLIEDPKLRGTPDSNSDNCRKIIGIGIACTHYLARSRPTMEKVYQDLTHLF